MYLLRRPLVQLQRGGEDDGSSKNKVVNTQLWKEMTEDCGT